MFKINLQSISSVKDFVGFTNAFDGDVTLKSGRYIVDGKSIMGIFSLDLSKPIEVEITPIEKAEAFKEQIKDFIVK